MSGKFWLMMGLITLSLAAGVALVSAQEPLPQEDVSIQADPGTAFTYQGQLKSGDEPVNGACDFQFSLWDAGSGGIQVGETQTKINVLVSSGYFTIPDLDFGSNAFPGAARWLAIAVRCPAGGGSYTPLSPRQALTPAPYALALPGLWTQQNAVSPNVIGGYGGNSVTDGRVGATIGGGGASGYVNRVTDNYGTVGGGAGNTASGNATVGGGYQNTASGGDAAIGGGWLNTASGEDATIGGGYANTASNYYTTIGGGYANTASNYSATIGGGSSNTASGEYAIVGGGSNNTASGTYVTIGGGLYNTAVYTGTTVSGGSTNTASHDYAAVGGGAWNTASGPASTVSGGWSNLASGESATVGGGDYNVAGAAYATIAGGGPSYPSDPTNTNNRVSDDYGVIGGGGGNHAGNDDGDTQNAPFATISGGHLNIASDVNATIGGGAINTASAAAATVGGGTFNTASDGGATIGGGVSNTASGDWATIGGGHFNVVSAAYATIAGGGPSDPNDPSNTNNRVTDDYGVIGGGGGNRAGNGDGNPTNARYATVGGGYHSAASGYYATIGGGAVNTASGDHATVGGGQSNTASFLYATVGGGAVNTASGSNATVGGGYDNTASGSNATVGGGAVNTASGSNATVGGGYDNIASGFFATVPGGIHNIAQGDYSFAAGRRAQAFNQGCFVLADASDADEPCVNDNRFVFRVTNGFYIWTTVPHTAGVLLPAGGNAWSSVSDRAAKENFVPVDVRDLLERAASIPIQTWNYKSQDASIRHIGPVAQDFYSAFGVGEDDRHISTIDADGVALAAIQGLYQLSQDQAARIESLEMENAALLDRLNRLERRIDSLEQNPANLRFSQNSSLSLPGAVLCLLGSALIYGCFRYHGKKYRLGDES